MKSICDCCRYSMILVRGESKIIRCTMFDREIPNDVDSCSEHKDKRFVDKRELIDIAWLLDPNKRTIGFIKPGSDEYKRLKSDPMIHYDP